MTPSSGVTKLPPVTKLQAVVRSAPALDEGRSHELAAGGYVLRELHCEMVCPCTVSAGRLPAPVERCAVTFSFHVDRGVVEGVDVPGLTVILVADTPQVMADGGWRVGVIMDAAASADQAARLDAVFSGELGGPMAMFAPLIGERLGVESVPIEYVDEGRRHSVRAGDLVDIEIEDYVAPSNPTGEVARLTGMLHVANSTLTIAAETRGRLDAFGLSQSTEGLNGHSAPFSWVS